MIEEIAIIVLNYNTADDTLALASQLSEWGYYVVVVDNASTDDSMLKFKNILDQKKGVDIVSNAQNTGYAAGNNLGIRHAIKARPNIKYIAIMNPDISFGDSETLENLCALLQCDANLAGITAMTVFNGNFSAQYNLCANRLFSAFEMIFSDVTVLNKLVNSKYKTLIADKNNVAYVEKMQGCFFVMKREIFEQVRFLDEHTFLYFEEDILGFRLRKLGYKLGVAIEKRVFHNHKVKDNEMKDKSRRRFYNKCMLDSKKYYMLNVMHAPFIVWKLSQIMDVCSRVPKDLL